jgi:hypothetical protein
MRLTGSARPSRIARLPLLAHAMNRAAGTRRQMKRTAFTYFQRHSPETGKMVKSRHRVPLDGSPKGAEPIGKPPPYPPRSVPGFF